jgi:hypothetical protein
MEAAKNPAPFEILLRAILLTRRVERVNRLFPLAYSLKTSWMSAKAATSHRERFRRHPFCSFMAQVPARFR